ncbi:TlpA disulfide reductase family protein [Roseateles chitosanitabidus]|jgi:peroxiredoxin|uniref:TlpA disulfide reductase family protein n=1 Tax=Roseateles chitosanitabidus TaxID=65048 RepID=UPI0008299C25|nr:TlpA disulfide reductase family protein [Roseateles chitosanitabidus]MBO9689817.1 TlpA family protein disulfide reductase [Roseateles chitosanitabidus]
MKLPRWSGLLLLVAAIGAGAGLAYEGLKPEAAPSIDYVLLDGTHKSSTQAWTGKVMLVNFWATSCTTCVKEMPNVISTYNKYKDKGFDTLAIAMSYDPPAYVANYAETRALPFGVAMDSTGEMAKRFGKVQLTPTTFLINKRGEIVKRFVGEPDFAALHGTIEKLLAES